MDGWMDHGKLQQVLNVGIFQCDGMDLFPHIKHLNILLSLPPSLPLHKQLNSMGRILTKKKTTKIQKYKPFLAFLFDRQAVLSHLQFPKLTLRLSAELGP